MKATLEPLDRRPAIEPRITDVAAESRSFSVDFLRCYATFQVLLIHASVPFVAFMHAKNPWWAACVIDAASRSAVPLFFMISGMLLLEPATNGKKESITFFLKRRFTKVVAPLIAWSLIYVCISWIHNPATIKFEKLNALLSTPACYHLGFLFVLAGLYLATPILRVFIKHASRAEIKYLVGLWLVGECLAPVFRSCFGWYPPIMFQLATGSVGIFVMGYLLRDMRIKKKHIALAFLLLAAMVACNVVGTFILTDANRIKQVDQTFFNYNHPLVVAYTALTFVLLRSLPVKMPAKSEKIARALITSFAAASFTIYLTHPIYLEHLQTYGNYIFLLPGNKFVLTFIVINLIAAVTGATGWLFFLLARKLRLPAWLVP